MTRRKKVITTRAAVREALAYTAAVLENADLEKIFADTYTKHMNDDDVVATLETAKRYALVSIKRAVRPRVTP